MLIKYFADIRDLSGCTEERIETETPSLRELLAVLFIRHDAALKRRVMSEDELSPTIIILINGRHVAHLEGLDSFLDSEDTVAIFPMVAGG